MKNVAKVLSLVILGTLLLSGCNLLSKDEPQSTTPAVVNADTLLDQQIYSRAIGAKDAKACATIKDAMMKTECVDVVNALILTDQAVAKLDDGLCGDIKLKRYEEECENQVESLVEQKDAAEKQKELTAKQEEERVAIEQKAVDNGDYKLCDSIKDGDQKYSCRYNVLVNDAVTTKDPATCDKIGEETFAQNCKAFLESTKRIP